MLIFDCTQAACEFFSSKVKGKLVSPVQPASAAEPYEDGSAAWPAVDRWQLHCVKFGRTNVLIAAHAETRFAMMFAKLKPGDVNGFIEQFCGRYQAEIMLLALNTHVPLPPQADLQRHLASWGESMTPACFFKRNDRSVQGHISQVLDLADYYACEGKGLPVEPEELIAFDQSINKHLRKIGSKGDYFHPDEEMLLRMYPMLGGTLSSAEVRDAYRLLRMAEVHPSNFIDDQ